MGPAETGRMWRMPFELLRLLSPGVRIKSEVLRNVKESPDGLYREQ